VIDGWAILSPKQIHYTLKFSSKQYASVPPAVAAFGVGATGRSPLQNCPQIWDMPDTTKHQKGVFKIKTARGKSLSLAGSNIWTSILLGWIELSLLPLAHWVNSSKEQHHGGLTDMSQVLLAIGGEPHRRNIGKDTPVLFQLPLLF